MTAFTSGDDDPSTLSAESTVATLQSLEEIPLPTSMSQLIGVDQSSPSSTSSLGYLEEELDLEMGFAPASDNDSDSGSFFRVDISTDIIPEAPIVYEESLSSFSKSLDKGGEEVDSGNEGEDAFATVSTTMGESDGSFSTSSSQEVPEGPKYKWQLYAPDTKNIGKFLRWAMVGGSEYAPEQTDEELLESLAGLARCLHLLREYLSIYGMPERGGHRDQELVLREIILDLYAGGTPLWALEPVMQKAAEGLTGQPNVNWQLYPRRAFVYNPAAGTTSMFPMVRGFNISKMSAMEGVAIRLASFASNVEGVSNIPARFPNPHELHKVAQTENVRNFSKVVSKTKLAQKILNLASKQQGLFYYINSRKYMGNKPAPLDTSTKPSQANAKLKVVEDFWIVTDEERELFSHLACQEALTAISAIYAKVNDPDQKTLYTPAAIRACRALSSAGACAFWFQGSWQDMIVAGFLAVVVAFIGTSSLLSKQERLVYEVVASFVVGLTSGLLALTWPDHMCFSAMAISGILDLVQGFRVVYAIIEIMSKHTVSGGADLLEGILFTGLISYFLQFGSHVAASLAGDPSATEFTACHHGLDEHLYIFIVPITSLAWAFLFTPNPRDLIGMAFHGVLGYSVNFGLRRAGASSDLNYFVSATVISLSAGIFSRFTGRQAVANTVAGMYTILPGAYLVSSVYLGSLGSDFFTNILKNAVVIGVGGWTGTILCSPTLMGTTQALLWQRHPRGGNQGQRSRRSFEGLGRRFSRPSVHRAHTSRPNLVQNNRHQSRHSQVSKASLQCSSPCPHHQRIESNVSAFDFEHPTSTMLFF